MDDFYEDDFEPDEYEADEPTDDMDDMDDEIPDDELGDEEAVLSQEMGHDGITARDSFFIGSIVGNAYEESLDERERRRLKPKRD